MSDLTAQQPRRGAVLRAAQPIPSRYIAVLDPDYVPRGRGQGRAIAAQLANSHGVRARFIYDSLAGFAFEGTEQTARWIALHPAIAYVQEDGLAYALTVQSNPPWGLDRIDQPALPLDQAYVHSTALKSVPVYVLDTGIQPTHTEFIQNGVQTAVIAGDFLGGDGIDCHGHGTHVASTIGGRTVGVARFVSLRSMRVLDCSGSGAVSGIVAAIDQVVQENSGGRAVMNLSLGGGPSQALDDAIRRAIAAGVVTVVAAGNSNEDAVNTSPARVVEAVTVGATTSADARASYSNYGVVLDIFAPGSGIRGASHSSSTGYVSMSGTSMATPHVAGAAALYLQGHPSATPAEVAEWLVANAAVGRLSGVPGGTTNRLLQVGSINSAVGGAVSVPAVMHPGQQYTATVTFTNTGASSWTGSTATPQYAIGSQDPADNVLWGPNRVPLPASTTTVLPDGELTLSFPVTAPTGTGTYNFQWQMIQDEDQWFGTPTASVAVQVVKLADDAVHYIQSVPAKMQAGQSYNVSVSYTNAGETAWSGAEYALRPVAPSWDMTEVTSAQASVQPGEQIIFNFSVQPLSAGVYPFQWMLVKRATGAQIGDASPREDVQVGTWADDAELVSAGVPLRMRPGVTYDVPVTYRNRGSATWTTADPYVLAARQQGRLAAAAQVLPVSSVAPGELVSFSVPVTAPSTSGVEYLQWQMANASGGGEWFGEVTPHHAIHVADWALDAEFVGYEGPVSVAPGASFEALVTFRNTGTESWTGMWPHQLMTLDGAVEFASTVTALPVESVVAGATVTIPVALKAPDQRGRYLLAWQMFDGGANTVSEPSRFFGEVSGPVAIQAGTLGLDVATTAISGPPAAAAPGAAFKITDTATNNGSLEARISVTRYYLSLDPVKSGNDTLLTATRSVPLLPVGGASTATVTVSVVSTQPLSTYTLFACADDTSLIVEVNETNNCLAAAGRITIALPDLTATPVSHPVSAAPGETVTIGDRTENSGLIGSGSSTTRYHLSVDAVRDAGDILLSGSRSVSGLASNGGSTGTKAVTVPANTALGTYRVLACADDTVKVKESVETNNCLASAGTILVALPDLITSGMTASVSIATPGTKFTAGDTVTNQGNGPAAASTTRYYLSADAVKDAGDLLLSATRSVQVLAPGLSHKGTKSVVIPAATPDGTYHLLACADDLAKVTETTESNNCAASASTVQIGWPDLVISALGSPPAESVAGGKFSVSSTVTNQGTLTAAASTVRFYLSNDQIRDAADRLFSTTRSVSAVVISGVSTGTSSLTVPSTVPAGAYYLLACADATSKVAEIDESNNCRVAATILTIVS